MAAIERAWFIYTQTTPSGRATLTNYSKLSGGPFGCSGSKNNICAIFTAYATTTGAIYNYHFPNANGLSSNMTLYINNAVATIPAIVQPAIGLTYVYVRES